MATPSPPKRLSVRSLLDLPDDLIGEILLRLPAHDPGRLVRCSAVCKAWRCLLTDRAFLRGYRAFHGVPPMLGFLFYLQTPGERFRARFVRTTSFRPPSSLDHLGCYVRDARHGRILFSNATNEENCHDLFVWNPITDERWGFPMPGNFFEWSVAVLCASAAREGGCDCDHLDCHRGPFLVAFVDTNEDGTINCARLYSSEDGAWSDATYAAQHPDNLTGVDMTDCSALVGNRTYFLAAESRTILEYDLGRRKLAFVDPPSAHRGYGILMPAMGGGLGFASVRGSCLYLWSRETGSDSNRTAAWTQSRVLELNILPGMSLRQPAAVDFMETTAANLAEFLKDPTSLVVKEISRTPIAVGFAEGLGVIFVTTDAGVFAINLKSGRVKKMSSRSSIDIVIPYMSFYTPDLAKA